MSAFVDVVHHVATVGDHVLEWLDGEESINFNGHHLTADEVLGTITALTEAAASMGLVPAAVATPTAPTA